MGLQARTKKLIVDVLATQLHGVDILEVWDVSDPIEVTAKICRNLGMADPEARLIWSSGKGTIMACYHVGFYSGEELIGQGKSMIHCFSKNCIAVQQVVSHPFYADLYDVDYLVIKWIFACKSFKNFSTQT